MHDQHVCEFATHATSEKAHGRADWLLRLLRLLPLLSLLGRQVHRWQSANRQRSVRTRHLQRTEEDMLDLAWACNRNGAGPAKPLFLAKASLAKFRNIPSAIYSISHFRKPPDAVFNTRKFVVPKNFYINISIFHVRFIVYVHLMFSVGLCKVARFLHKFIHNTVAYGRVSGIRDRSRRAV
jgi:hypothetical protein